MNGILEQLILALNANTQALMATSMRPSNAAGDVSQQQYQLQTQVQPQQQYVQPQTQVQPQQTQFAPVSGDQITALIQPHVDNPAIKDALGVEMRALGINALPETPQHLSGNLYARFQGVLARFGVGAQQQPQQQAQATSII